MSDFDETVKKYYQSKPLSPERLNYLLAQKAGLGRRRWFYRVAGMAAVLLIGAFGGHWQFGRYALVEGVLAEVAMNHRKQLAVEVASDQYQVVQAALDRLDFPILPAQRGLLKDFQLVGGRYCSIRGGLAAQLKVRDRITGEHLTLYITPATDALAGIAAGERNFDEVRIRLWQESGRFFALARGL